MPGKKGTKFRTVNSFSGRRKKGKRGKKSVAKRVEVEVTNPNSGPDCCEAASTNTTNAEETRRTVASERKINLFARTSLM